MVHVKHKVSIVLLLLAFGSYAIGKAVEQEGLETSRPTISPFAANVVLPQTRVLTRHRKAPPPILITSVMAGVDLTEQTASTTLLIGLRNPSRESQEAEIIFAVPDGVTRRKLMLGPNKSDTTTRLIPKKEARHVCEALAGQTRDSSPLEFAGYDLIRSSPFIIAGQQMQQVILMYENAAAIDAERIDYVLPRTDMTSYPVPWNFIVQVQMAQPVATLYSPSHELEVTRESNRTLRANLAKGSTIEPSPFRVSCLFGNEGLSASLFAYPDPTIGGGYFLLLACPPPTTKGDISLATKREVTLVLDRSASMNGERIKRCRAAILKVIDGLRTGETFNIFAYNETVSSFANAPVKKTPARANAAREFLDSTSAFGATNMYDVFAEVLSQKSSKNMLPLVLFLTDGTPTIGETSELAIRKLALESNTEHRRIYTFGIGTEINAPMLDMIARDAKGTNIIISDDQIEGCILQTFDHLQTPTFTDITLEALTDSTQAGGKEEVIRHMTPENLPDLFEDDTLITFGQYLGSTPIVFNLSGNYLGRQRSFPFRFTLDRANTRNAFVQRLWASRRIGMILDNVRQSGADADKPPRSHGVSSTVHPIIAEQAREIARLSLTAGVFTKETVFMAGERLDLSQPDRVAEHLRGRLEREVTQSRSGSAAVNQSKILFILQNQKNTNGRVSYLNSNLDSMNIRGVQHISDRTFFKRGNRWLDSRLFFCNRPIGPDRIAKFGSGAFQNLLDRLVQESRQGCLALPGEILLLIDDEMVLVQGPDAVTAKTSAFDEAYGALRK